MRLTTRFMLLTIACLLPTLVLAGFIEVDQRAERKAQLEDLVLRQAELLNGDISSIALGARGVLAILSEFQPVRTRQPSCAPRLAAAKRELPSFAFLAVLDRDGRLVCSSNANLAFPPPPAPIPEWAAAAAAADGFTTGRYADPTGIDAEVLPFSIGLTDPDGSRAGAVVAGLDLGWLAAHLQDLKKSGSATLRSSALTVADRDGVVLARNPLHADYVGKRVPALLDQAAPAVARIEGGDGGPWLVGYVPATQGSGLLVSVGFLESDLMADINRASLRDGLLLAAAALVTAGLGALCARRFVVRPTAELVGVARRWRAGELGARAEVQDSRSEFGQIAAVWNEMAESLERREAELRGQALTLESRVAERTRALSETNNRLQVEIAERQQTEAALVQAQKLQTVGHLAGGIAHDFNNLLATILGSLELIGRDLAPGQTSQRAIIERASNAVQRGAQLTGRLLAFSRRKPLAVGATDINRLIADLGTLLATSTLGRRIVLDMQLDPTPWPALAEPGQVEAAILNLALNARDAMPGGGVLTIATGKDIVTTQPTPTDPKPGEYVSITLRDTGEGMSEAVAKRALEPFFTTKGSAGSGLGLSQVVALCREVGGAVRLETAPKAGTTITLLLPRAHVAPVAPRADAGRRCPRKWNILLVDDDDQVRGVTADMLAALGSRVRQAANGGEALAALADERARPDLLMVDYAMPGMNGLAFIAAARRAGFVGPALLATGYAERTDPEPGEGTADAVLHKPFTSDDLAGALARLARAPRSRTAVLEPAT